MSRKNLIVSLIIGVAYFFLHTDLVGIAAAIAMPEWFVALAQKNQVLSLVLFSLVTTVPAAALASVIAGYAVFKWVTNHRVWWGIAIVLGITLYSAWRFGPYGSLIASLKSFVMPPNVIHIPNMAAWWLFLPLSVALFTWRSARQSK